MKNLSKQLALTGVVLMGTVWTGVAGDPPALPNPNPPISKKEVLLPPKKELPTRPHSPARVFIKCEYAPGYLSLTLPSGVYYATVGLNNDSYEWTGLATTEQPLVELPDDLAGEYTIICRTDDGRVFSGTLEF